MGRVRIGSGMFAAVLLGARGSASEAWHEEAHGHEPKKGSDDDGGAQEGEHVAGGARGQVNNRTCPGG